MLHLVRKSDIVPPRAPLPFDDWRAHVGSHYSERMFVRLDWELCQHEFYICACCSRLWMQRDRPSATYDECWNCWMRWTNNGVPGKRSWLGQLWVQIVGAA